MLKEYFIYLTTNVNEYAEKIGQYDSLAKEQFTKLIERIASIGNKVIIRRGKKK